MENKMQRPRSLYLCNHYALLLGFVTRNGIEAGQGCRYNRFRPGTAGTKTSAILRYPEKLNEMKKRGFVA